MARKPKPEDNGTSKTSTPRKLFGAVRVTFLTSISSVDQATLSDAGVNSRDDLAEWTKNLVEEKLLEMGGPRKMELLKAKHAELLEEVRKVEGQLGDALE